jgi:acid phosphatase type 7
VLSLLATAACAAKPRTLPACQLEPDDAGVAVGVVSDPVLLAAGDIAECGDPGSERTAKLLDRLEGTIAALGDNVYETGTLDEYLDCYEPTWGRHRWRTRPAVGNHEYRTPHAGAYFAYFCGAAGEPFKGWYSYDLGTWHIVVLNSNCSEVDCDADSEQARWLRADLESHPTKCTAAYWHHPRFSSGEHGNADEMAALWQVFDDFGGDVVLAGHEHDYERFAPQSPSGAVDEVRGIREFVVGTGGRGQRGFGRPKANSELRQTGEYGVLSLTLRDGSYDWKFIRVDGYVGDTGHGECH